MVEIKTVDTRVISLFDTELIRVKLLNDSPENASVKSSWTSAQGKLYLPIYTYANTLLRAGVGEGVITKLYDLLVDLHIKVDDAHASSSELSIVIGFMSKTLLGVELKSLRRQVDEIRPLSTLVATEMLVKPTESSTADINDYKRVGVEIDQLHESQRKLILSSGNYTTISRNVLNSSNEMMRKILSNELPVIWRNLGIDEKSEGALYYRDLKTFAGDVDIFYWGPNKDDVNVLLSKHLMPLGYKVDHRSNFLVNRIIDGRLGTDNSYLGAYLFMYFFMGKLITFNKASFNMYYCNCILPSISLKYIWPSIHKWILDSSYKVEAVYSEKHEQYPGFKDLPFRFITAVLMGLSIKCGIPFTLDFEHFLSKLVPYIDFRKIEVVRDSFYYINQIRNIYQILTERRWEMVYPNVITQINQVITKQGGVAISDKMGIYGKELRELVIQQFGILENPTNNITDFTQHQSEASEITSESYRQVTELYQRLSKNSIK